jgi:uncharacterized protein YcnI
VRLRYALVGLLVALAAAPAAAAHIEIAPETAARDSVTTFTLEVPNERTVPMIKLEVKLPAGVDAVRLAPKTGWKGDVRAGVMTWTGGAIAPEGSERFVFRAHLPTTPATELVFPAIQSFTTGPVTRWIGAPSSETPAPRVTLEGRTTTSTRTETIPPPGPTTPEDGGEDHGGLAIGIGIAIAAGLLALGLGLLWKRRA